MNFDSVAKEIVANSIRSAICIDDEFVEPYKEKRGNVKDTKKPKHLTESFRKGNCSLDIYTYTSYRKLKQEKRFVFKNRDLVVLDWELTNGPLEFEDTLLILKDAIEDPSLEFVLIYTKKPDLANIELQIRSIFNNKARSTTEREKLYDYLLEILDDMFFVQEQVDFLAEEFFENNKIRLLIKELVARDSYNEAVKAFKSAIRESFPSPEIGGKFLNIFEDSLKKIFQCKSLYEGCEQIDFHFQNAYLPSNTYPDRPYCKKVHGQQHALWINNTYITIFSKNELEPDSVYQRFSDQLCKRPGNIMTLIGLEMKNKFRENSGKIGKDLLAIDELAFFHHKKASDDDKGFYEFLRNNWKHQVAAFHLNSDSLIFDVLDEYFTRGTIDDDYRKVTNGHNEHEFRKELAKLNYQYSFLHVKRKKGDYTCFGDIYSIRESAGSDEITGYLLNITAHCDCLRPEKIEHQFHFVKGKSESLVAGLKNVAKDDKHYSFLDRGDEVICIAWQPKSFTINIPENKRFFSAKISLRVKLYDKFKFLFHEGTLLENYTQRIANKSFGHAGRVGIDLVGWEK